MPASRLLFRSPSSRLIAGLTFLLLLLALPAIADSTDDGAEKATVSVESWLALDAAPLPSPAFRGSDAEAGAALGDLTLALGESWPAEGEAAHWPPGATSTWSAASTPVTLNADGPAATWLAVTLENERFLDATFKVESAGLVKVWVDGEEAGSKTDTKEDGAAEATLALDTGSHRILVLAVRPEQLTADWTVAATLEATPELTKAVSFTTDSNRPLAIDDLLQPTRAQRVDVSPDGAYIAINLRRPSAPSEGGESWIDILTPDGEVVRTIRNSPSSFDWSPAGDGSFVYLSGGDVRLGQAKDGAERVIARGIADIEGVRFATDQTFIVTTGEAPEADERGVKRYRDAIDRWTYRRNRSHHHLMGMDGSLLRLTVSDALDELQDISPDGTRALIARSHYEGARRPFRRTELMELDLGTLEARTLADLGWFTGASYSPDGASALILGSAALFDNAGSVLAADRIVNDYDTQAYLFDLTSGEARALTRDFDPSIQSVRWTEDRLYLRAEDRSWQRIYTLDSESLAHEAVPTGVDMVHSFDVDGGLFAWVGSSVNRPHAVWTSEGGDPQLLLETSGERFADVGFGEVRDWSFTSKAGDDILGRVYLPPGVDEEAAGSYPLIVYYYGGTAPVGRSFGGRYPKELWAAQGYVVYILQPSGTTGFGQEFAARHVNAWGRQTADEILEGTKRFLDAHPFVDPERIGAIGASYGGFMTMYLQTRSDIFAAAVSHAGISNLASYWGQGWWGYLYSDAASAGSFPWNNKELYVGQSPLYAADKIETPLLLITGDADTNVPPVESHQMYTALEVLGKEVELIEIGGQDHQIRSLVERRLWSRTILAWFDYYLKGQPEMWQHLWGTDEKPKG